MNIAVNHRLKCLGRALFVNNLQVNRASIKINRLDLQLFDLQSKKTYLLNHLFHEDCKKYEK